MKLMIDIPKELYEDIQRRSTAIQADGDTLENAVLNGTIIDNTPDGTIIDNTSDGTSDGTSEEITKPFWETSKKNNYGYLADLTKLPVGTTFNVVNGAWSGRITEVGGKKYIVCIDTGLTYCIKGNEELVINDVVLHRRKQ